MKGDDDGVVSGSKATGGEHSTPPTRPGWIRRAQDFPDMITRGIGHAHVHARIHTHTYKALCLSETTGGRGQLSKIK